MKNKKFFFSPFKNPLVAQTPSGHVWQPNSQKLLIVSLKHLKNPGLASVNPRGFGPLKILILGPVVIYHMYT